MALPQTYIRLDTSGCGGWFGQNKTNETQAAKKMTTRKNQKRLNQQMKKREKRETIKEWTWQKFTRWRKTQQRVSRKI